MPRSCKCILDNLLYKSAITVSDYDKILRNIKMDWIPAAERLPKEIGDYIVTKIDDENEKVIGLCYFSIWGWTTNKEVIAWMPLPKPYEKGAEE